MAGGVALNSVANGRIMRETPFKESTSSRRPATPAAHWARRCTPITCCSASRAALSWNTPTRARVQRDANVADFLDAKGIAYETFDDEATADRPVTDALSTGRSSACSRDASSGGRARWAIARSWPTPAAPR